jgi:Bacterial Ig-like domain (group 3)
VFGIEEEIAMHKRLHLSYLLQGTFRAICIGALTGSFLFFAVPAYCQVSGGTDVNLSQRAGHDRECAIAKNPSNRDQLFVACNTSTGGMFAARSIDGGATWVFPDPNDKTLADGDFGQGVRASWDPSLAWDTFGNLYFAYLDYLGTSVHILLSTDSGATFHCLGSFGSDLVDQPTVIASPPGAPPSVWIVWHQMLQMRAVGAKVTGLGAIDPWGPVQTIDAGGVDANGEPVGCTFGDVAISPTGAVVQACQSPIDGEGPSKIFINTDADGLGPASFGASVAATTTNVGGIDFITPLDTLHTDAEAGLAYDSAPASPHKGRLYLVYTDEVLDRNNNETSDTDIMLRFSDDDGANWSDPPIRVNDDLVGRSQFLPRIAANPASGNIAVCWFDARNSTDNKSVQQFCSIATPTGASPAFLKNAAISDGSSTGTGEQGIEFGDYSGLVYFEGVHPVWADTSNSGGSNPDGTTKFDAYTDIVTGGWAANEGDPHITTLDGVNYDFQSAGDFVLLRGDGLEIQVRQTPLATQPPEPDPYTGLLTCISLNSAVAARVGKSVVSYQPNILGTPDLKLYVDGKLQVLDAHGVNLDAGGRVVRSSIGNGIEIEFPNGTHLIATPGWLSSQSMWYLNINVYLTTATEGIMGVIARGSWLPALPDGTSLGKRPATVADRYVQLNRQFADAWRVKTSLFQPAQGTATLDFTMSSWPLMNQACVVPTQPHPNQGTNKEIALKACSGIIDKKRMANCVFDVTVTGETSFADTYVLTQRLQSGATKTTQYRDKHTSRIGEVVTFSTIVARKGARGSVPTGTVQFILEGLEAGEPVKLDAKGSATWKAPPLRAGQYRVSVIYTPIGTEFFPSRSRTEVHTVLDQ